MSTELALVMPVYNEEAAIPTVLDKWANELSRLGIDYRIAVYNDGSKDNTLSILNKKASQNSRIVVCDKKNSGHGPTILKGYRENCDAEWIFQIDSDDEMGPEHFETLWKDRNNFDFLIGLRQGREQALPRKIVSGVSRAAVWTLYGKKVSDVNAPYRLMRSVRLKSAFAAIPESTFAPNVIISGLVASKKLRVLEVPVPHTNRKTGEVSIKKWKLAKAAAISFFQTCAFRFSGNTSM